MRERVEYIDFSAGIMILWMIICHALLFAGYSKLSFAESVAELPSWMHAYMADNGDIKMVDPNVWFPYLSFFMAWFFYKSGLFFEKHPIKSLMLKDSHKLLWTFIRWSFVGYVIFVIFGLLNHSLTIKGATYSVVRNLFYTGCIQVNVALWFLLTLFVVQFLMNVVLPSRNNGIVRFHVTCGIIVVISYLLGYVLNRIDNSRIPLIVANTATGCTFFTLGYWLRGYNLSKWLIIPSGVIYLLCCIFGFDIVCSLNNQVFAGNYLLSLPEYLASILLLDFLSKAVHDKLSYFSKTLKWIGKNAMWIYVSHYLICKIVYNSVSTFECETLGRYSLLIILIGYAVLFLAIFIYKNREESRNNLGL